MTLSVQPSIDLRAARLGVPRVRLASVGGALRALGVFVLVQALFWLTLSALERLSQPAGLTNSGSVELVLSDKEGNYPPGQPVLRAAYDPWPYFFHVDHTRAPAGKFMLRFDAPQTDEEVGFYFNPGNTMESVHLNGQLLNARLNFSRWAGVDIFSPTVVILPKAMLMAEGNVIEIQTATRQRKHLSPYAIGPANELERAAAWGALVSTYLPLAALAVMAFTLILCAITYWPDEDRPWIKAFMLLLVSWGACNVLALGLLSNVMPEGLLPRNFVTWSLIYWYQFAFLAFVLRWVKAPARVQVWVWLGFAAVLALAMVAHFWTDVFDPVTGRRVSQELRKLLEHSVTIALGLGMSTILLAALAREREPRSLETFLFLTGITAITVDAIDDRFRLFTPLYPDLPLTFAIGPAAGLFMALGMSAALARHAAEARRVVVAANRLLSEKLGEREAELRVRHEAEKVLVERQALLEERQRIVRDMHDGFGGQLIALAVQVKSGQLDAVGIERAVSDSLVDLRLIVDSLDSVGESLDVALVALRDRLAPTIRASGKSFEWDNQLRAPAGQYGPQTVLHVFRVLQEAVSNALRHSGASRITITVEHGTLELDAAPDCAVIITVRDDGTGFPETAGRGKGLTNMRARAERCGGRLVVKTSKEGTSISLGLPQPPPLKAQVPPSTVAA